MKDIVLRSPSANDLDKLKSLWNTVFGSVAMDAFFAELYNSEMCYAVFSENELCAMGYLVEAGELMHKGEAFKTAMIYSVATASAFRGKGYAKAVVDELAAKAFSAGYPVVVLSPSEDSLFEFYEKKCGFSTRFYIYDYDYPKPVITAFSGEKGEQPTLSDSNIELKKISVEDYIKLRTSLLKEHTYIKLTARIFEYQKQICDEVGGGFYLFGDSCAIIEMQDDLSICVKELLSPHDNNNAFISAIAEKYPSDIYTVRTPASSGTTTTENTFIRNKHNPSVSIVKRRFGMIKTDKRSPPDIVSGEPLPWYGLALD